MNKEQLLSHVNAGDFNIPSGKDESKLITNNPHFPNISLYPKEYNGTTTYIAVFGDEIPRLGLNALVNIDGSWYVIPVVADADLLRTLKPVYSSCMLLSGFASTDIDANKLVTIATSLSTPFGFSGIVEKKLNAPSKRFPTSYSVKLNKTAPFSADLDGSISLLNDINWDE